MKANGFRPTLRTFPGHNYTYGKYGSIEARLDGDLIERDLNKNQ